MPGLITITQKRIGLIYFEDVLHKMAAERWGKEIGDKKCSYYPHMNDDIVLIGPERGRLPDSKNCLHFFEIKNLLMANTAGLILLELLDREHNFLPSGIFVKSYDHFHNLYKGESGTGGHRIPYLIKEDETTYFYGWYPYLGHVDQDEMILAIEKNS